MFLKILAVFVFFFNLVVMANDQQALNHDQNVEQVDLASVGPESSLYQALNPYFPDYDAMIKLATHTCITVAIVAGSIILTVGLTIVAPGVPRPEQFISDSHGHLTPNPAYKIWWQLQLVTYGVNAFQFARPY